MDDFMRVCSSCQTTCFKRKYSLEIIVKKKIIMFCLGIYFFSGFFLESICFCRCKILLEPKVCFGHSSSFFSRSLFVDQRINHREFLSSRYCLLMGTQHHFVWNKYTFGSSKALTYM